MITPPLVVPSFYTALFERTGAQEIMKLVAPTSGKDIDQVLVTSIDMASDLEASVELRDAIMKVMDGAGVLFDEKLKFNPLYLPTDSDVLAEAMEVDDDGVVKSISGFDNPFITMNMSIMTADEGEAVLGKVCYKQFELPPYNDIFESRKPS
jgi:hypothetical protein